MTRSRLADLHDYLCAVVPISLVVAVMTFGSYALGVLEDDIQCLEPRVGGETVDVVAVHRGFVPLEHTCEFADGSVQKYVPTAASIVMYGGLIVSAGSFGAAWAISRRLDRAAPPT